MDERQTRAKVHEMIDEIPVPTAAVNAAIGRGVAAAGKKRHWGKRLVLAAAVLVIGTAGAAAVNPAVGQAVSNAAWLGEFYLLHGGQNPARAFHVNGTATALAEQVTSHGLTVRLVEAYYSGKEIGITGEVTGMTHAQIYKNGEDELGLDNQITPLPGVEADSLDFAPTKTGYRFTETYRITRAKAPTSVRLPITITHINGVRGDWRFKLNFRQKPAVTHELSGNYTLRPGVTLAPLQAVKYSQGAELRFSLKFDQEQYLDAAITDIRGADGHSLLDLSNGFDTKNGVNSLPLKQLPNAGQSYRVRLDYQLKTQKRGHTVVREIVLVPKATGGK
ncbi:DUF4179 domain-containing protein [Lacticaseibacillus jixianensis]|uniref:DUF4179 domain-containing protein n=1 Tax=Lacticaseibacillus jixianensis TaxID=2486012 RepID=A0ABW4BAM8_9LACO|nr:DUF4179 domain-containing protein [Lacticaseibacillus jixianensis]